MKKVLIGCLIFVVLLVGLIIGGVWYGVTKLKSFTEGYGTAIAEVQQVNSQYPWSQPVAGTPIAPTRFEEYLTVRTRVNDRLMRVGLFAELASSAQDNRAANITAGQIFGLLTDIPGVVKDAAAAFRDQRMSFNEFGYYSFETLRAIRTGAEAGDPEMASLWERLRGMATSMDNAMNSGGNSSNFDVTGSFDTLSSTPVAPETVAVVRTRLGEFTQNPARYVIELGFVRFLDQIRDSNPPAAE